MYEQLFVYPAQVALVALVLASLAAALNGNARLGLALVAFGFPSAIAAAFYLVGFADPASASRADLVAGFVFEFSVLMLYCRVFFSLRRQAAALSKAATRRVMVAALLAQAGLAFYFLSTEGFGLFSEGERIDFLLGGASAKFFTYGSVLLSALQAALLASRISSAGRLQGIDYATALLTASMSVLSGSKGGFFLWVLSVLSLVDYRQARVGMGALVSAAVILAATLVTTARYVGESLGLDADEFLTLALSRFFLSNDARALAFDLQGQASASATLLGESFRSLFAPLGFPPLHPPLGQLLYELNFDLHTGAGANTSAMALIVFFSPRGDAWVPVLGAIALLLLLYATAVVLRRLVRGPTVRLAMTAWGATSLQLFTQDFLAFQLLVPLGLVGVVALLLVDRQAWARPGLRWPQAVQARRLGAGRTP